MADRGKVVRGKFRLGEREFASAKEKTKEIRENIDKIRLKRDKRRSEQK
ncbi:hypothetical protein OB236_17865 [Paenibacillus sp. WQ 127069]|uniref:Uncharacterized protein n=1 Tax=Paenibacillus baimaensis TaxID=2982185 RepID=A0ABT2UH59_9BACL|nr:hypothetical protein [Paenibacillus sp. WQ 127069]MCU6793973.1 hypothetical protein [Paenibacillus sp. WQ 127069]